MLVGLGAEGAALVRDDELPQQRGQGPIDQFAVRQPECTSAPFEPVGVDRRGDSRAGHAITIAYDVAYNVPTAVVFLAHWCPHGRKEVPAVQAWLDGGGLPGGEPVRGRHRHRHRRRTPELPAHRLARRRGWTPPTLLDDDASRAGQAYGLTGYPYWVLLDGNGRVTGRHAGALPVDEIEQALSALR